MKGALLGASAAALAAAALGCAEIGRPPGGPIDTTPPAIVAAFPESLATGVDPAAPIRVTFSESVDKNSVRDWFFIRPYRRIDGMDWDGPTAVLRLRGGLPSDSTISFVIGSGVLDRDGNRIQHPFRRTFATGDSLWPGAIEGSLRRTRITGAGGKATTASIAPQTTNRPGSAGPAVFIWLYKALGDSLPDFTSDEPDFLTEADVDGHFVVDGLPLEMPLIAVAINDGDRSRSFLESRDYATVQRDTLRLTATAPVRSGVTFDLIDPKAPGQIAGTLAPAADTTVVDTLAYGVILSEAPRDGGEAVWPPVSPRASVTMKVGATAFTLTRVPPGLYRIAAFRDANADGRWTLQDSLAAPLPVEVRPAEETGGIVLPRPPRRAE